MDILTHILSGIAVGTVVSSFSKKGFQNKFGIILVSGIAAFLPDVDAISLWSGFDANIGSFFNLPHSGKYIYSAKLWYSHHAFFHSALAGVILSLLLGLFIFLKNKLFHKNTGNLFKTLSNNTLLLLGFVLGYLIHLLEDIPTPSSTWGGINFFFPSDTYIGGTGDIWWWNNYDIFLIVLMVITFNLLVLFVRLFVKFGIQKYTIGVFLTGFIMIFIQIKTRQYDFSYSGHTKQYQIFEQQSKRLQKEILGNDLYKIMEKFDNSIRVNF